MKKYIGISIIAMGLGLTACDDFLDKLPDNRTEANTEEKIQKLLIAAYPTHDHMAFTEYASDNVDDMGENNPNTERFIDQLYNWEDLTETDNQDTESYWMDLYQCIETANMALEGIESMGGATTKSLRQAQAEALLCRAYAHFMLVNLFAQHYDANNASALGISYVTETEKELNPQYQRETVHENYKHIEADIESALPNVGDSYYSVPKYHFNRMAAFAFATRFFLYYEKYDRAIECANVVLGSNPSTILRDWAVLATMPNGNPQQQPTTLHVIDPTLNANLLLMTSYSHQGVYFGGYRTGTRYSHNSYIGKYETIGMQGSNNLTGLAAVWGGNYQSYAYLVKRYTGSMDKWSQWRMPYEFETTDPVAGIGYGHTVYNAFTTDEVLLNRAEAYIMKKDFNNAVADLNTWMLNVQSAATKARGFRLTTEYVKDFMNSIEYAYTQRYEKDRTGKVLKSKLNADLDSVVNVGKDQGTVSSLKKHLNPKFAIDAEGSEQESLLQLVIAMRRYETLHEGKRWFDIKRWGIKIPRRVMDANSYPDKVTDWLEVDDPRRAIQIPMKVREAGYEPNPRTQTRIGSDMEANCIEE